MFKALKVNSAALLTDGVRLRVGEARHKEELGRHEGHRESQHVLGRSVPELLEGRVDHDVEQESWDIEEIRVSIFL